MAVTVLLIWGSKFFNPNKCRKIVIQTPLVRTLLIVAQICIQCTEREHLGLQFGAITGFSYHSC